MKVALIQPPQPGNLVRGVGYYTQHLYDELVKLPGLEIELRSFSRNVFEYQSFDIIHFPYFDLFRQTLTLIPLKKVVVTLHDVIPLKFPQHFPMGKRAKIIFPIQKMLLERCDFVVTDSNCSKNDIQNFFNISTKKIKTVYLSADDNFSKVKNKDVLKIVSTKYSLPKKFVLYVGGVNWNKNLPNLVRASQSAKIPLVVIGKEVFGQDLDLKHPESGSFREFLDLIANDKNIIRLGFVPAEDLTAIYSQASVYVQPSIYEGFGLPVLEAMKCECPVICGNNSSLPEIGGNYVLYTDVSDVSSISRSIVKVTAWSANERSEVISKALKRANEFSWRKTAEETYAIYKEILS